MQTSKNFIDKDKNGFNLTLCIFDEMMYATVINPTTKVIEAYEEINLLSKSSIIEHSFSEVKVVMCNSSFTLIPNAIFNESHLEDYLKFSIEVSNTGETRVTGNDRFGLKVIWHLEDKIKNEIVSYWPGANFKHLISSLFSGVNEVLSNNSIFVRQFKEGCSIFLFEEDQLKLANYYDCKEENDALYYVMLTLNQTQIDTSNLTVYANCTSNFKKMLNEYFPKVESHSNLPASEVDLSETEKIYSALA